MSKSETNRKFVATPNYRDNYDNIFNTEKEDAIASLTNDINYKMIYQKDNSHGSDIKED